MTMIAKSRFLVLLDRKRIDWRAYGTADRKRRGHEQELIDTIFGACVGECIEMEDLPQ